MPKTVSLKDLPNKYIAHGMSLSQLCEYLNVSRELILEWEGFFNLFPESKSADPKTYSKAKIKDFIKVKDLYDRGTPLHEIKRKLFRLSTQDNPFENTKNIGDFKPESDRETIIKPLLTQINRANERIGELILEKANLVAEITILKTRNIELMSEKENFQARESTLVESLKISHDMLRKKEDELQEKNRIIYSQNAEINSLLEEKTRKWWNRLKDLFL